MLICLLLAVLIQQLCMFACLPYRSQVSTKGSVQSAFGTDGTYNLTLLLTSAGEGLIEIIKEPLLPKEHPIHVKCFGREGKVRKWTKYVYNGIHNYRQSLGMFPDVTLLTCTVTINNVSHDLVAAKIPEQKAYAAEPIREPFRVQPLAEGDSAGGNYEWSNRPLYHDKKCIEISREIAAYPPIPEEYRKEVKSLIGNRKVYISLTTSPGRLLKLHYTLRSLTLDLVERVFITLPKRYKNREKYTIPYELCRQFPEKLQLLSASFDIGPALKAVGAAMYLQEMGRLDDILIVIDDDNVYGRSMIDTYVYFCLKYPNAVFTCTHLAHITSLAFPPVPALDNQFLRPCYVIEGFAGYASRVANFDTELIIALVRRDLNPELSVCYLSDDVVISLAFALKGVSFQTTWTNGSPFYTRINRVELPYYQDEYALHLTHSDDSRSDKVINDPKYYATIEIWIKYALDRNTAGMHFLSRNEILARIGSSYRYCKQ